MSDKRHNIMVLWLRFVSGKGFSFEGALKITILLKHNAAFAWNRGTPQTHKPLSHPDWKFPVQFFNTNKSWYQSSFRLGNTQNIILLFPSPVYVHVCTSTHTHTHMHACTYTHTRSPKMVGKLVCFFCYKYHFLTLQAYTYTFVLFVSA